MSPTPPVPSSHSRATHYSRSTHTRVDRSLTAGTSRHGQTFRSRLQRPLSFRLGITAFAPRQRAALPIHEPVARIVRGPRLAINVPSPNLFVREVDQRHTRPLTPTTDDLYSTSPQNMINYARTDTVADLVLAHHRERQSHAWKRRRPARRRNLRMQAMVCSLYGTIFIALLVTLITLFSTASHPIPNSLSVPLTLLTILFAILFLHTLLRIAMAAHSRRMPYQPHSTVSHGGRRRKHTSIYDAFRNGRATRSRQHGGHHNRRRRHAHEPTMSRQELLSPNGVVPAAFGPDALPDDDSIYSPTTPVRVHMVHDADLDDKHAAAVNIEALDELTSPLSPVSAEVPLARTVVRESVADEIRQVRDVIEREQANAVLASETSNGSLPRAPPPAYGLWRCSVRADPNLLHWRRVEELAGRPAGSGRTPPVSPVSPLTPSRLRFSVLAPLTSEEEEQQRHAEDIDIEAAAADVRPPSYDSLREQIEATSHAHVTTETHDNAEEAQESEATREVRRSLMLEPSDPSFHRRAVHWPSPSSHEDVSLDDSDLVVVVSDDYPAGASVQDVTRMLLRASTRLDRAGSTRSNHNGGVAL